MNERGANRDQTRICKITDVNPSQGIINMTDQFGTLLRASFQASSPASVMPLPGEVWIVQRVGHDWFLDKRFNASDPTQLSDLQPGDGIMEATNNLYLNGAEIYLNGVKLSDILAACGL